MVYQKWHPCIVDKMAVRKHQSSEKCICLLPLHLRSVNCVWQTIVKSKFNGVRRSERLAVTGNQTQGSWLEPPLLHCWASLVPRLSRLRLVLSGESLVPRLSPLRTNLSRESLGTRLDELQQLDNHQPTTNPHNPLYAPSKAINLIPSNCWLSFSLFFPYNLLLN